MAAHELEQPRNLDKEEIDRQIGALAERLVAATAGHGDRPRWISPRELVRRVRPFLVLN
jgi:hypothetical protein